MQQASCLKTFNYLFELRLTFHIIPKSLFHKTCDSVTQKQFNNQVVAEMLCCILGRM